MVSFFLGWGKGLVPPCNHFHSLKCVLPCVVAFTHIFLCFELRVVASNRRV